MTLRESAAAVMVLLVAATFLALPGRALAHAPGPLVLQARAPAEASVGNEVELGATLLAADGTPIRNATVRFYAPANFAGVEGDMEIGQVTTDRNGVVTLPYHPRQEGELTIRAVFAGDDQHEPEEASFTLTVTGSSTQVYKESAGIQVPGLNVWLLIAALTGVWSVLFFVAVQVFLIARDAAKVAQEEELAWMRTARGARRAERGESTR